MVQAALWDKALTYTLAMYCIPSSPHRSRSHFTTDSQSVCLGIEHPCGNCDQILLPVGVLLSEICGLVSVRRPL
jgi:hypothetical protein